MMKYNLGCGHNKIKGFINVDKYEIFCPDKIIDLEQFPWDIESNSADVILLHHVLEHIGETQDNFINVMKELYRIAKPSAKIDIIFPHPYSSDFIADPTHVRSITEVTLRLFSKKMCDELKKQNDSATKLAHIHYVDFEITNIHYKLNQKVCEFLISKNLVPKNLVNDEKFYFYTQIFMNMIKEVNVVLEVKK